MPDTNPSPARSLRLLVAAAFLAAALPAAAGEPLDRLHAFFQETRALKADFRQEVLGPEGQVQERSHGEVWIQRPDHFRWNYDKPYRQLIVADGDTVQFYDPEMAQVTVRSYRGGMGHTPSMVLSGGGDLDRHFRVHEEGMDQGLAWVTLEPRQSEEAGFRKARVGLAADPVRVKTFEFGDAFGNRTRIRFRHIRINPPMAADRFRFEPPPGTDVLGGAATNH
ncbi:MAG TPA: outer membrane lipoprotein chaperone LolA [Gammaproteobacteria bacterium]|nr:outer membrane lipoprotein chaperone LolA [Gammaproteobacteria bacterium]